MAKEMDPNKLSARARLVLMLRGALSFFATVKVDEAGQMTPEDIANVESGKAGIESVLCTDNKECMVEQGPGLWTIETSDPRLRGAVNEAAIRVFGKSHRWTKNVKEEPDPYYLGIEDLTGRFGFTKKEAEKRMKELGKEPRKQEHTASFTLAVPHHF